MRQIVNDEIMSIMPSNASQGGQLMTVPDPSPDHNKQLVLAE